jgi:hypothetical protein
MLSHPPAPAGALGNRKRRSCAALVGLIALAGLTGCGVSDPPANPIVGKWVGTCTTTDTQGKAGAPGDTILELRDDGTASGANGVPVRDSTYRVENDKLIFTSTAEPKQDRPVTFAVDGDALTLLFTLADKSNTPTGRVACKYHRASA